MKSFLKEITRRKPLQHIAETQNQNDLHRTLSVTNLTSMGVGAVVGAGIFVITGQAAAVAAGPALALSFIVSAISCFFSGICYAELSAAIPLSGSAYTFTYVAVGEFAAWMVAICLGLEYLIATAAVSVGWSGSVQSFLAEFSITIPEAFSKAPIEIEHSGSLGFSGSIINLPAVIINILITIVLCLGVRESASFNNVFVVIKLSVLLLFIAYGVVFAFSRSDEFKDNLTPFIPENTGTFGQFGISGIFRGAGMVYFSYVGFDAVCAMAQECKNPSRDLPRGLLFTLIICTTLYVVVTVFLTGMANYTTLNVDDPVPHALRTVGAPAFIRYCVDVGAISGLTSVCLISLMCMPRLLYTLSHDGLLPPILSKVHERFRTPLIATVICGFCSGLIGGLLPLDVLGELVSAGTLMAFMFVCYSVITFRRRHPEYPRPFRVPFVPYFPAVGIVLCMLQMTSLPPRTLIYYTLLQLVLFGFYAVYGRKRSVVKKRAEVKTKALSRSVSRTPTPQVRTPQTRTPTTLRVPSLPRGSPGASIASPPCTALGASGATTTTRDGLVLRSPSRPGSVVSPDATPPPTSSGQPRSLLPIVSSSTLMTMGHTQQVESDSDSDGGSTEDERENDYTDHEMDSEEEAAEIAYGLAGAKTSAIRTTSYATRIDSKRKTKKDRGGAAEEEEGAACERRIVSLSLAEMELRAAALPPLAPSSSSPLPLLSEGPQMGLIAAASTRMQPEEHRRYDIIIEREGIESHSGAV